MHWRAKQLSETLPETAWLPALEARAVYRRVEPLLSRDHYGFDSKAVCNLQRVSAEDAGHDWLTSRIPRDDSLLLVFGPHEVCRISASLFYESWQDLFCPSRDDVVILSERGSWVLFYCHEDEFEFGQIATP